MKRMIRPRILLKVVCGAVLTMQAPGASSSETITPVLVGDITGTTLDKTIAVAEGTDKYKRLTYQPGWPLIVRQELVVASPGRTETRRTIVSFAHLTDMHITDAQSPARNPFARKSGIDYRTDFRNQGLLTLQVGEAMVRKINSLTEGPATGAPLSFAISTGDNGDGRQVNELKNYVALLDGGRIAANSSGQGYIGVQDDFVLAGRDDIYDQYWHPDRPPKGVPADRFKRDYDFPEYPGLLQAATTDFNATGLNVPWYSGNGNHDGTLVGYFRARAPQNQLYWNPIGTGNIPDLGSQLFLDLPAGMSISAFEGCLGLPTPECVAKVFSPDRVRRPVPANPDRAQYLTDDFLDLHFQSPPKPGPVGHGFTERNKKEKTLYYTFDIAPEIVGIMLDTVNVSGKDDGSIGSIQAKWLEDELRKNSSNYVATNGEVVSTGNADKLVVLFSHHNLLTMGNDTSLADDPDPVKILGDDLKNTILRYRNVVLWVNGHSHVNRIWSHKSFDTTKDLRSAFWEINTASHIDYPQQSRVIELADNGDGTLSIFATLLDHMAPPQASDGPFDVLDMAAISRELSVNDPDFFPTVQIGGPGDRNVELLIEKPF